MYRMANREREYQIIANSQPYPWNIQNALVPRARNRRIVGRAVRWSVSRAVSRTVALFLALWAIFAFLLIHLTVRDHGCIMYPA